MSAKTLIKQGPPGGLEAIGTADTLPKLLLRNARKHGSNRVAILKKTKGIWKSFTWADYYQAVKLFSMGMVALGLKRGDKVAIIGDNDPEWYFAELAAHAAGATSVGVFPDVTPTEMAFVLDNCDANVVVARDQEQVDKFLSVRERLPLVIKVIYWYPKGMWQYADPMIASFAEVQRLGEDYEREHPGAFEDNVQRGNADYPAILSYTSGTTGLPKGAVLTHRDLIEVIWRSIDCGLLPLTEREVWLSYTSPAWATDQYSGITTSLLLASLVGFAETPETMMADIRELAPTNQFAGPLVWEQIASTTQARISDAGLLNRACYGLALAIGYRVVDLRSKGRPVNLFWQGLYALATLAVFRPLKDRYGFSKLGVTLVGGAPLGREVLRFFHAWGIQLRRGYGTTELGGVSVQPADGIVDETVGKIYPWKEVRISEEGEILVKSNFAGYYKNPTATAEKLRDGWFHTGDAGYITESGELVFLDRLDNLAELANGAKFAPQFVETMVRFSPYIAEAVAIGGGRFSYPTLVVIIDYENTAKWAERRGITFATYADLSQKAQVRQLILSEVRRLNRFLPEQARVQKFVILHKELDPDDQELTRTRKVRRQVFEKRYSSLLDAIYEGRETVTVESEVVYADGKRGKTVAELTIVTVAEARV